MCQVSTILIADRYKAAKSILITAGQTWVINLTGPDDNFRSHRFE